VKPDPRPLAVAVLGRGVIDPDEPVIHADDPGLLRGLAAFETLRVYRGLPFAMPEHLKRLRNSAARMHLDLPDLDALQALARDAVSAAGRLDCALRFTVTAGRPGVGPVAMVVVTAVPSDLEATRQDGISVISLQLGTDPRLRKDAPWLLDGVKSTSYAVNMAAWDEARRRGADDAIFVAAEGSVRAGPVTNVWWRGGDRLFTPARDLGILAGVTRAYVIALAATAGYEVREGWYPVGELMAAAEIFTSSSVRELMPVVRLDGQPVGHGTPGDAATALQLALRVEAGA
jgi:4-amino-4-deoxychorismate lyase